MWIPLKVNVQSSSDTPALLDKNPKGSKVVPWNQLLEDKTKNPTSSMGVPWKTGKAKSRRSHLAGPHPSASARLPPAPAQPVQLGVVMLSSSFLQCKRRFKLLDIPSKP